MTTGIPCRCGCGQLTNIATGNNVIIGVRRGEPYQWRQGHRRIFEGWVADESTGCWNWVRGLNSSGYGNHRGTYRIYVGPIPRGLTIDHLCRNRACVNPAHLEAVTYSVNLRRIHPDGCTKGHPWSDENTYAYGNRRCCRPCRATAARDRRARRAASAA